MRQREGPHGNDEHLPARSTERIRGHPGSGTRLQHSSEYVRELIRNDQTRRAEQRLTALILEGLESGLPIPGDETYWSNKRATLQGKPSTP